jgi:hypothetical protein
MSAVRRQLQRQHHRRLAPCTRTGRRHPQRLRTCSCGTARSMPRTRSTRRRARVTGGTSRAATGSRHRHRLRPDRRPHLLRCRIPGTARHLADQGAMILFVPFCTDERRGFLRVRYCCHARAIENQIYVALSGVVGNLPNVENMDIHYAESCILTPCDFAFARDGIAADTARQHGNDRVRRPAPFGPARSTRPGLDPQLPRPPLRPLPRRLAAIGWRVTAMRCAAPPNGRRSSWRTASARGRKPRWRSHR